MNIYAINVCTDTKTNDRYHKVAVNEYPIIIIGNDEDLRKYLSSEDTNKYIKGLFRTKQLYDVSVYRIRKIVGNNVEEIEWKIPDINNIVYDDV